MGGEIRYVVETENGSDLHVISMADISSYETGEEVALLSRAVDCRILKPKPKNAGKRF